MGHSASLKICSKEVVEGVWGMGDMVGQQPISTSTGFSKLWEGGGRSGKAKELSRSEGCGGVWNGRSQRDAVGCLEKNDL